MTMTFRVLAVGLVAALARSPAPAQPPSTSAPRRIVAESLPGVSLLVGQRWGVIGVKIANPTDQPVDVLSSHYFGAATDVQFGRRLWIPARAARESWYPVLAPENPRRAPALPVESLLIDRRNGGETLLGEAGGRLAHEGLLPAYVAPGPVTGFVADPSDPHGELIPYVARVATHLPGGSVRFGADTAPPASARLDADTLPPDALALQALDQLVVATDRFAAHPAAAALAVRQWLRAGGRLWVQLDRVSPETVALLLGRECPATVVDRVGLTNWCINCERTVTDPDHEAYDAAERVPADRPERSDGAIDEFEAPVEMVRAVVPGVTPVHTVNGWPASFWVRSGRGSVLFTTLAPRGWVVPRGGHDHLAGTQGITRFKESEALRHLAGAFFKARDASPIGGVALDPLLVSQVGYRVVGRGVVSAVLATFCLGLVAGGWWLNRRGALAHLGWAGPAAGLAATGALVAVGVLARSQAPPTSSSVQFVEIESGAAEASVTGRLAFYAPDGAPAGLGAERGGVFVPDAGAGTTHRMVRTDLDRWHWENMALAPGLHPATFSTSVPLSEPVSARVTFGPAGAVGTLAPGPLRNLEDAVLAMPSRVNLVVKRDGSGGFTAGDRLPAGQYLASGVLSGDQQHRRTVYQQLLEPGARAHYPRRPTLLAWADPPDLGFTFVDGARRTGSALVAVPLEVDRPAPGTRVTIPAPFLPFRTLSGPDLAVLYEARKHTWLPRTAPARALVRFQVPTELLPLQVERAVLEIDLNASDRPVEVFAPAGNDVLARHAGSAGTMRIELDRAGALQPDPTGGLVLGVAVGGDGASSWKITDLRLELIGQIPQE